MKVYIAGASSEIARAEKWMALARAAKIEVVSTWPGVIRKVGAANPMTASRQDRARWAATDLAEVSNAEAFWFLLPEGKPTAGAYTELGYSVALAAMASQARAMNVEAPIFWIICSGKETSIFTALADHFETDEEALQALTLRASVRASFNRFQKQNGPEVSPGAGDNSEGG